MKKTTGIVNCPIHPTKDGEDFPTENCPGCRPYQDDGKNTGRKCSHLFSIIDNETINLLYGRMITPLYARITILFCSKCGKKKVSKTILK